MAEKSLDDQLWDAAGWHGTDDEVRTLLARGANVKSQSGSGALVYAVAANRLSTVQILLAAGADINGFSFPLNSPLMHAPTAELTKFLLDCGASVAGIGSRGDALHLAIGRADDVEQARLLLDHGLRPIRYLTKPTAGAPISHLAMACQGKRSGIARVLLEGGGSVAELGSDGTSVVETAIFYDDATTLVLVSAGAVLAPNHLDLACRWRSAPVVAVVLGKTTGDATTAAERAASRGDVEILRILIESDRVSHLDAALRSAARHACGEAVAFLMHCGADPMLRDADGCNAIHAAALGGSVAILERFVAAGCPFDLDGRGRTALHHAATGARESAAMLRELVVRGLDLEAHDAEGATPIESCATILHTNAYDALAALGADARSAASARQKAIEAQEAIEAQYR